MKFFLTLISLLFLFFGCEDTDKQKSLTNNTSTINYIKSAINYLESDIKLLDKNIAKFHNNENIILSGNIINNKTHLLVTSKEYEDLKRLNSDFYVDRDGDCSVHLFFDIDKNHKEFFKLKKHYDKLRDEHCNKKEMVFYKKSDFLSYFRNSEIFKEKPIWYYRLKHN